MTNKIHPTAIIHPSVKIGDHNIIGAYTIINDDCIIGNHNIIGPINVIERGTKIGNNCSMQPHCVISIDTIIEDNVFIGPHYSCSNDPNISDGPHGTSPHKSGYEAKPITLRNNCMLGSRVSIAPGITVGQHARIDMCCFITKNVEPYSHMRSDKVIVGKILS